MTPKIPDEAIAVIESILKRGNNAVIKRCKDGIVVSEEVMTTKYRTTQRAE